ncbi:prephenate dehydratase [Mycoblastus sanguinarius]|nr:prephenate dehydratase [Mycoblastus sanguinarius]
MQKMHTRSDLPERPLITPTSGQAEKVIAYLGPLSSYTHQAAAESFDQTRFILEPQISIRDVFAAVQSSSASFGVVPYENSSNGHVSYTLDLLIDRDEDFPDIQVCGEAYLDVKHCLLGHILETTRLENSDAKDSFSSGNATPTTNVPNPRKPRSRPLTSLQRISRIYSHPQAFGQCEAFLSTYLKCVERKEVSSTSKAAALVAQDLSGTEAAISSRFATDVHPLDIMAEDIQDQEDNSTRFLMIQKGTVNSENQAMLPKKLQIIDRSEINRKALVAFSVNHDASGALANALMVFKKHELNLTGINMRPSRIRPWHYIFLVEFEGKKELEDPDLLHLALKELDTITEGNKWLGCWIDRLEK